MTQSSKTPKGFTIIETVFVIAMAGLIFGLFYGAIPALFRNSHNGQRKQDVSAVLSSVSHYQISHSGLFPVSVAVDWVNQINKYTNLSHYDVSSVILHAVVVGDAPVTATTSDDSIDVYAYMLCNPDNGGAKSTGAGYRDIVALYNIEKRGGYTLRCQQL